MLHDTARIQIEAGAGGDGSTSFRREAHVPRGGPDGGDGGRGGDVVLVCDGSLRDLQAFRRRSRFRAGRGGHGQGSQRHGADGQTLEIRVPPGTEIRALDGDEGGRLAGRRWELLADGQRTLAARGGSGGKGNKRFATATRQAPRFAERGLPGESGWLQMRLKLLADAGLVGLPNAGKSSLLSRLTRAAPKVADYPFTTLEPVLGVLDSGERQLVVADIPGLIEGASEGAGLGHDFLAHVERTRVLVHVLDIAPELTLGASADAVANYETIERELAAHDARLAALPRILALSKADLVGEERRLQARESWRERLGEEVPVIVTSSATGLGIGELGAALLAAVPAAPEPVSAAPADAQPAEEELLEHMVFRPAGAGGFTVERLGAGSYAVRGRGIELLLARHDIENEDAMDYLEGRLRRIGVLRALQDAGFRPGDEIEIGGVTFELDPAVEEPSRPHRAQRRK
ncbi:MAG TPA: GTPase ObgE [Solirubrobacteraceae bacterium]|jgi:GTP-binding protein|nr:GTPase ObgE [Solirubrobacteraceae bacterium]